MDDLAWQKLKDIVIPIEKDLPIVKGVGKAFDQSIQLSACLFVWLSVPFFIVLIIFLCFCSCRWMCCGKAM